MHCRCHVRSLDVRLKQNATINYFMHLENILCISVAFYGYFSQTQRVTADGPMAIYCLFCFVFVFPSSCKIGVWLNTCKLCCDYQPLKSSLKINLYIVKFPRLLLFTFWKPVYPHWACCSSTSLLLCISPAGGAHSAELGCFWPVRSHLVLSVRLILTLTWSRVKDLQTCSASLPLCQGVFLPPDVSPRFTSCPPWTSNPCWWIHLPDCVTLWQ